MMKRQKLEKRLTILSSMQKRMINLLFGKKPKKNTNKRYRRKPTSLM